MIRRLEQELEERNAAVQGIIANANDTDRDLNDSESETLGSLRTRMGEIQNQLTELEETSKLAGQVASRAKQLDQALKTARRSGELGEVEYRSAGAYIVDLVQAANGSREAQEKIEVFHRAAAHQKSADNLGVIPDPIVGETINFIDAARPIVSVLGPQALPSNTWHRPVVSQSTSVDTQGAAGAAADEKTELVSQKMTITRLSANAVTYGGYVNVSRQNIDFTNGQVMDIIVRDLAAQYAIQTEAALGTELDASTATAVGYGVTPDADTIRTALWSAAEDVYSVVAGQGRLVLALAPDRLPVFGPLFAPISGVTAEGEGMSAGSFGSGLVGSIAGIPAYMSAGIKATGAFLLSTAAIEVFEQRVGTLQVTEPSVLGVQVAYAGYFTPLTIDDGGIIELTQT
jgi:HK97 family phage major capsid protein